MIKTQLYIDRLHALAGRLYSQHCATYYKDVTSLHFDRPNCLFFFRNTPFLIHPAIELQLPLLFGNHFRTDFQEVVKYLPVPQLSAPMTLCFFFGLNIDEYRHLLLVGKQVPEKYGGRRITPRSGPRYYAHNIACFLRSIEGFPMMEDGVLERKVMVEKVRKNDPTKIFADFKKL